MNVLPRLLWACTLLVLLSGHAHAHAQFKPVAALRTRVTDEVGMLAPAAATSPAAAAPRETGTIDGPLQWRLFIAAARTP